MNQQLFRDSSGHKFFNALNRLMTKAERVQWNELISTLVQKSTHAANEARSMGQIFFLARKSAEKACNLECYIRRIPHMELKRKPQARKKKVGIK